MDDKPEMSFAEERFWVAVRNRLYELMDLMDSGMSMEDAMKKLKWGEER